MTDPNYCAIMLVIDRSGSMMSIRESAQEAINKFFREQANQTGRRTIRVAQFNGQYESVHGSTEAHRCPVYELRPGGSTALFDAIGRGLIEFGEELAALSEVQRPSTVIFAIMTDGWENSSKEFNREQIRTLIGQQERDYDWQILYLGANQDAIAEGASLGVRASQSMTYAASPAGMSATMDSLDSYVASSVSSGTRGSFTNEDRERATDQK